MTDKGWQSEWAARLSRNVSRRDDKRPAQASPPPEPAASARAAGGFAVYSRGKSRQTPAQRRALAELMGVLTIAKSRE